MKNTMRRSLVIPAATLVLFGSLSGCGSDGPKLTDEQKRTAVRLESEGNFSKKDAECIAGKLSGDALAAARNDANFSELSSYTDGDVVAQAFTKCTGKNFEDTYHYNPRG